jgi:hypothetical protein
MGSVLPASFGVLKHSQAGVRGGIVVTDVVQKLHDHSLLVPLQFFGQYVLGSVAAGMATGQKTSVSGIADE